MRRLIFAALILACCATQTAPQKIRPVKVTVLPDGTAAKQTARALKTKPYLDTVQQDPHELISSQAEAEPEAEPEAEAGSPIEEIRAKAKEALEQARSAFRNLRFDLAISQLSQAQAALVPVAETEQDYALLVQHALQQGINRLALKQEAEAREAFSFAFSLGYTGPQPGQHPPEVEAFIWDTQRSLNGATHGGLTVTTQPTECQVLIDGKNRGESPVTVQIPPGLHHLRVTRFGHHNRALIQRVTAGKVERLEIYLKPLPVGEVARQLLERTSSGQPLTEQDPAILRRILGSNKALVHVGKEKDQLRSELYWTGVSRVLLEDRPCLADKPAPLADCLGPLLYQVVSGKPYRAASMPAVSGGPIYRRWWFWTLIAAGVAGGTGAGIYFGTRDTDGTDVDIVSAK